MRRYRRIRTGYRSGTKKKSIKKIVVRVLFTLACAAALTGASILLGRYLKGKADLADSLLTTENTLETESSDFTSVFPDGVLSDPNKEDLNVFSANIDVTRETPETIKQKIASMSEKYNCVSVDIVSDSGSLVYLSEALLNYVRLDPDAIDAVPSGQNNQSADGDEKDTVTDINVLENINVLITEAKKANLRVGAVFSSVPEVLSAGEASYSHREIDRVILGELHLLGFDEVIITGLVEGENNISHETLKSLVSYLAVLRRSSEDMDIGVMLPASVYLIPQSASTIKTLSQYVDFLAIAINTDAETQDSAYSSVYDNCHSLKGNFSVYDIRGVITSENTDIACAVYAALRDLSVSSTQFTVFIESPEYTPEHLDSAQTDSLSPSGSTNENANRKEDYTNETENDTDSQG